MLDLPSGELKDTTIVCGEMIAGGENSILSGEKKKGGTDQSLLSWRTDHDEVSSSVLSAGYGTLLGFAEVGRRGLQADRELAGDIF